MIRARESDMTVGEEQRWTKNNRSECQNDVGPGAEEYGQPLKAGKGVCISRFSLAPPEGNGPSKLFSISNHYNTNIFSLMHPICDNLQQQ